MANTFDIGNVIRLSVTFADIDGDLVDPTDVQLNVRLYGGEIESFTYLGAQITRSSVGVYYYDYTPAAAGQYFYRFVGTGDVVSAGDKTFNVTASPAVGNWPAPPAC